MGSGETPPARVILMIFLMTTVVVGIPLSGAVLYDITAIHETNVEADGAIERVNVNDVDVSTSRYTVAKFTVNVSQGDVDRVELYRPMEDGKTVVDKIGVLKEEESVTLRSKPPRFGEYTVVAKKNGTVVGTAHFVLKDGQTEDEVPW